MNFSCNVAGAGILSYNTPTQPAEFTAIPGTFKQVLFKPLKPSGYSVTTGLSNKKFSVLSTECICEFCVDLRTNTDYIPIQS